MVSNFGVDIVFYSEFIYHKIGKKRLLKKRDREAFKNELRSGQFYKYSVMEKQELFEQYGYLSQYGLVAYTKDYYNEEYKE